MFDDKYDGFRSRFPGCVAERRHKRRKSEECGDDVDSVCPVASQKCSRDTRAFGAVVQYVRGVQRRVGRCEASVTTAGWVPGVLVTAMMEW